MTAALSERVGRVVGYPPLSELSDLQRREFHEALLEVATFEDLPGKWQAAIVWGRAEPAKAAGRHEQLDGVRARAYPGHSSEGHRPEYWHAYEQVEIPVPKRSTFNKLLGRAMNRAAKKP